MARPRKFYVIYREGRATQIVLGRKLALKLTPMPGNGLRTRQAAEERAAWHNFEHPHWTDK